MGSKEKKFKTIGDYFFWCYSNLCMSHCALKDNSEVYTQRHYIIRNKMYKEFRSGQKHVASFYDDEKIKMNNPVCSYCGSKDNLSLDHLIPRKLGGPDSGDNLVFSCKACNSSKGKKNLLTWYEEKGSFPPILVLRKYLKIVYQYLITHELMDKAFSEINSLLPDTYNINLPVHAWFQPKDLIL